MKYPWFKAFVPDHPLMKPIMEAFGYEGYGMALAVLGNAHHLGLDTLDTKTLCRWLDIRTPKAEKMLPYLQELLLEYLKITGVIRQQSGSNTEVIQPDYGRITAVTDASNPRGSTRDKKEEKDKKEEREEPPKPPKGADVVPPGFEIFWEAYPNKDEKKACLELWKKKKLEPLLNEVLSGLSARKQSQSWQNGYIHKPRRFLKEELWRDVPQEPPRASPFQRSIPVAPRPTESGVSNF